MAISEDKERMTIWLDKAVKEELKRQAKENGVSVSAFVSMIVSERARENRLTVGQGKRG